jgi:hypothetical protein
MKEVDRIIKRYSGDDCTVGVPLDKCFETKTFIEKECQGLKDNICLEIASYSEISAKASKELIKIIRSR